MAVTRQPLHFFSTRVIDPGPAPNSENPLVTTNKAQQFGPRHLMAEIHFVFVLVAGLTHRLDSK